MNCLDCANHRLVPDPDPDDWFCDDDVAVVCAMTRRPPDTKSRYAVDRQPYRSVVSGCRPYFVRPNSKAPDWCPLGLASERT